MDLNPHSSGAMLFSSHRARCASGFAHWNVELGFFIGFSREMGGIGITYHEDLAAGFSVWKRTTV